MEEKLRPCPFCGGKAYESSITDKGMQSGFGRVIMCDDGNDCAVHPMTDSYQTELEANAAWNRREPHAKPVAALKDSLAILEIYAERNPKWYFSGKEQDPLGVHALLARVRAVLKELGEL